MRRRVAAVFVLALAGCTTIARHPAPPASNEAIRPRGMTGEVRTLGLDESRLAARAPQALAKLRAASSDGTIDILALSGGGAGGAFGAGALAGWTKRGDRPELDVVTGVSAGALIAPFAFLGPAWDAKLADALAGAGTSRILQRRWYDPLFRTSIYRGAPLAAFVARTMSDELIDAVARESARGRMLLIATTDLDKQSTVIWDLGAIARQHDAASRELFRKVLIASSSIPGVFPPVLIRTDGSFDEMHVDGGATVAFFVAPEVAHIVPNVLGEIAGANLYVIMNTQTAVLPKTTKGRFGPIVVRGFSTALTQMSRSQLQLASAFAHDRAMTFREAEIPVDYPYGGSIDFDPGAVRSLFEYGSRCAERGLLWTTLPDTLTRTEQGIARSASGTMKSHEVPCPAELDHPLPRKASMLHGPAPAADR